MEKNNKDICWNFESNKLQKQALSIFADKEYCIDLKDYLTKAAKQFYLRSRTGCECEYVFSSHSEVCYDQALRYLHLRADPEIGSFSASKILEEIALYHAEITLLLKRRHPNEFYEYFKYTQAPREQLFFPVSYLIRQVTSIKKDLTDNSEHFVERDMSSFSSFFYSMSQILEPESRIRESIKSQLTPRIKNLNKLVGDFVETFSQAGLENDVQQALNKFIKWWCDNILIIEYPMFSIEKIYRDHTYHSLRAAYLGNTLLNLGLSSASSGGNSQELIEYLAACTSFKKAEIRWGLMVCGLFHDIGIIVCKSPPSRHADLNNFFVDEGLSFTYRWEDTVEEKWVFLSVRFEVIQVLEEALKAYPSIRNKDKIVKIDISQKLVKLNREYHGLAGAVLLLSLLGESLTHFYNRGLSKVLTEIVGAIAYHDIDTELIEERSIKLSEHPMGFLLKLVDEVQEWGRPILHHPEIPHDTPLWREVFLRLRRCLESGSHKFIIPGDSLTFLIDFCLSDNLYYYKILEKFWDWTKAISSRKNNLHTLCNDVSKKGDSPLPKFKVIYNWPANEATKKETSADKLRVETLEIDI